MIENPISAVVPAAPGCQVCGRRDETLRLVSYPFAISVVFLTFRRAFTGVWCARHRRLRHFLAILITSTIGWLGVPFGLLYTPFTLIQLAAGGTQPKDANARLLLALGEEKCREGDYAGARRCYEAALYYSDDPAIEAEVRRLAAASYSTREEPVTSVFLTVLTGAGTLLVFAFLIGLVAGVLDDLVLIFVKQVLGETDNILLAILTWVPAVLLGVLGIFWLQAVYSWILEKLHVTIDALAGALAITSAMLFMYAQLAGEMVMELLSYVLYQPELFVPANLLRDFMAAILRGGVLNVMNALSVNQTSSVIQIVLIALMTAYAVFALTSSGNRSTTWRARVAVLSPDGRFSRMPAQPALVAIVAVPVMVAGLAFSIPQKAMVDSLEAAWKMQEVYGMYADEQSDPETIRSTLEEVVRLNPGVATPHIELARVFDYYGEFHSAVKELDLAEAIDPLDPMIYLIRGFVLSDTYDETGARAAFERSIALDSTNGAAYAGIGWLDLNLGDYEKARAQFEKARQLAPENVDALSGLGMIDFYQNKTDDAIKNLSESIRSGVNNFLVETTLIMAYLMTGEHDLAISQATALINQYPGHTYGHALLAMVYNTAGRIDEMEAEIQIAQEAFQDPAMSDGEYGAVFLANALMGVQRYNEAEDVIQSVLPEAQFPVNLYLTLAQVYISSGRYDEALAALNRVDGSPAQVMVKQAEIYLAKGDLQKAVEVLVQARTQAPASLDVANTLAMVYYYQGAYEKSISEAQAVLAVQPYSYDVLTFLSLAARAQGHLESAISVARRAVTLRPGYDLAHFALGAALAENNQIEEARPALQRFLELYRDRPHARDFKAEAEKWLK